MLRTNRQTESHTDADERFTPATVVGVGNEEALRDRVTKVHVHCNADIIFITRDSRKELWYSWSLVCLHH